MRQDPHVAACRQFAQLFGCGVRGSIVDDQHAHFHTMGDGRGTGVLTNLAHDGLDVPLFIEDRHGNEDPHEAPGSNALQKATWNTIRDRPDVKMRIDPAL